MQENYAQIQVEETIEYVELVEQNALSELAVFGYVEFEDEPPMQVDTREDAHAFLTARLDVLDEECAKSGVADALEWERWDEYENAMYCLAEFEVFHLS